jgi:hypothetical protein
MCLRKNIFRKRLNGIEYFWSSDLLKININEIAKEAKVDSETVLIDVPTVPSVPYHNAVLMESMEVPIFSKNQINTISRTDLLKSQKLLRA